MTNRENSLLINNQYKEEDDIEYDDNENDNKHLLKRDFNEIFSEEISEPDIQFWCKDNAEATMLLRKCIKLMRDSNWHVMKDYLLEISKFYYNFLVEQDTPLSLFDNDSVDHYESNQKITFVKNFYLVVYFY